MKQFLKSTWYFLIIAAAHISQALFHLHDTEIFSYIVTGTIWIILVALYKYKADMADDRFWEVLHDFEVYTEQVNTMMTDIRDVIISKKRAKSDGNQPT